jgi:hypothetical protein
MLASPAGSASFTILSTNRFSKDLRRIARSPFPSAFFKRPIEFQTPVMGGRRPGKRNF